MLLAERLFELGRYVEIRRLATDYPFLTDCRDRVTCLAAIQVVRAIHRLGDAAAARALLQRLEPALSSVGVGATRRLATARAELAAPK